MRSLCMLALGLLLVAPAARAQDRAGAPDTLGLVHAPPIVVTANRVEIPINKQIRFMSPPCGG